MEINAREARRRFSELLKLAECGETVIVTRRGKASVRLVAEQNLRAKQPLPDLTEFRASINPCDSLTATLLEERESARY
jgi:prevent-host-death family protein